MKMAPHDQRRGRLRNGNPSGDFLAAPRCGARTRQATACLGPAMRNGRCRLHGGWSTGPTTADGLARCRAVATKHGRYSRARREERRQTQVLLREWRRLMAALK